MPKVRESRFAVLHTLRETSTEADRLLDELVIPTDSALEAWFKLVKENFIAISECTTSLKDIEYPPDLSTLFTKEKNNKPVQVDVEPVESQRERIHNGKTPGLQSQENLDENKQEKLGIHNDQIPRSENTEEKKQDKVDSCILKTSKTPATLTKIGPNQKSPSKYINQAHPSTPHQNLKAPSANLKLQVSSSNKVLTPSNPTKSLKKSHNVNSILIDAHKNNMQTPLKDKTFNKITHLISLHENNMQTPAKDKTFNKITHPIGLHENYVSTPVQDKTFSKIAHPVNEDSVKCNNGGNAVQKTFKRDVIKTRSGSKRKTSPARDESSKKRKSSPEREKSSKKRKLKGSKETPVAPAGKSPHSKYLYPNVAKTAYKTIVTQLDPKNKAAVIVPPVQKQAPRVSKGRQILKEIKKKEEKAEENRKKVLAERQLKAEENKRKREEKRVKLLEKRLNMEKEKEKRELEEKKPQLAKEAKKSGIKSRVKELIDQNAKENMSPKKDKNSKSFNQNNINAAETTKTPVTQKSKDSDNYDLTPMPDSAVYDSDAEEERPSGKFIPMWAHGVHLKSALLQQFYNPPDVDEIFGSYVATPDLADIFKVQKKSYKTRSSSAIWHLPMETGMVIQV